VLILLQPEATFIYLIPLLASSINSIEQKIDRLFSTKRLSHLELANYFNCTSKLTKTGSTNQVELALLFVF